MSMDAATFRASLAAAEPPAGISSALAGLWWDARGDWDKAHQCAQEQGDAGGAAVHAYLHRKEGDLANARGWYARAGRAMPEGPLAATTLSAEWDDLLAFLLAA